MASYITYLSASGNVKIASDVVGDLHHQLLKLVDGRAGGADAIPGTATNGLWVDVTRLIPGTTGASLGKGVGAPFIAGSTGVQTLAVRIDAGPDHDMALATDGGYSPLICGPNGVLWVQTGAERKQGDATDELETGRGIVIMGVRNDAGQIPIGVDDGHFGYFQLDETGALRVNFSGALFVPDLQRETVDRGIMMLGCRNDKLQDEIKTTYGQSDGFGVVVDTGNHWINQEDMQGPVDGTSSHCDVDDGDGSSTDTIFAPFYADTPPFPFGVGQNPRGLRITLYLSGWDTGGNVPTTADLYVAISDNGTTPLAGTGGYRHLTIAFSSTLGQILPVQVSSFADLWGLSVAALKTFLGANSGILFRLSVRNDSPNRFLADAIKFEVSVDSDGSSDLTDASGDFSPIALDSKGRVLISGINTPADAFEAVDRANITTISFGAIWNGATWDRQRSEGTTGRTAVSAVEVNDFLVVAGTALAVKQAAFSVTGADATILAGIGARKIRVVSVVFTCTEDCTVTFKSNSTVLIDSMPFAANGGINVERTRGRFCETVSGQALKATVSAGTMVGTYCYVEVP